MSPVLLVQMAYPEPKYHKFSIKPPSLLNLPLIVITPLSPSPLISNRRMYFLITTLKLHVE